MAKHLIRVDAPRMRAAPCFGMVQRDGLIVEAAPYAQAVLRRLKIRSARAAVKWFRKQGADVQWWRLEEE